MQLVKRLSKVPLLGSLVDYYIKKKASKAAKEIAVHFSQFLCSKISENEEEKHKCFRVRHNVYCEELGFEEVKPNQLEMDEFDEHAYHCFIEHRKSNHVAGTVRVIYSENENQVLPIEKFCLNAIGNDHLLPKNFPRKEISEISRLAVPAEFRKRATDKHGGAATGVLNLGSYSEEELRCFPFIAIGLYLSATALVLEKGINHCFVMMEPRLARSLRFVGIPFEQIGPVVDYHGRRAPYHVDPRKIPQTLSIGFQYLLQEIKKEITGSH